MKILTIRLVAKVMHLDYFGANPVPFEATGRGEAKGALNNFSWSGFIEQPDYYK